MNFTKGYGTAFRFAGVAALLALVAAGPASTATAQTLRHASAFDPNSLDPHSLAWVMRPNIAVVMRPCDVLELRRVRINRAEN
jgi:hypothetical protein